MKRLLTGVLFLSFIISSCDKLDRPEKVPAFVTIEPFTVTVGPGEGTDSHNVTDAWLYVNSQLIGTYELPATVPVIIDSAGNYDIRIRPGIKNNGISAERKTYPFFEDYEVEVRLSPDSATTVTPSTSYVENIAFWLEEFESAGINFSSPPEADTAIYKTTDPTLVFEGAGAGVIRFGPDDTFSVAETDQDFDFGTNNSRIYLEFNYKTNTHFRTGIISNIDGADIYRPILVMTPTTDENGIAEWNKIYVELTENVLADINAAAHYDLFFEVQKDNGLTTTETVIDNVKLVYFN